MSSNRTLFKNLSFLSIAELSGKGLQVIYTIYLADIITPSGFGVYSFAQSILIYFILFVSFGIDTYGNREVAKDTKSVVKHVSEILSTRIVLSVVTYIALVFVTLFINKGELVTSGLLILGINIFSQALLLNWAFQGLERMEVIAFRQLLIGILNFLGIIFLIEGYSDTELAFWIMSLSLLVNSILLIFYFIKNYGPIKIQFNINIFKKILKSSVYIGVFSIIVTIYNHIDLTMIGFIVDDFEYKTGIYGMAVKIKTFAVIPVAIIQNSILPQLSRDIEISEKINTMNKYTKLTFITGIFISGIVLLFSEQIIFDFLAKYIDSIEIIKIFSVTVLLSFFNVTFTTPLVAWNKEKKATIAALMGVIVNIILNLILIPTYGLIGAAIATIICESVVLFYLAKSVRSEIKILFIKNFITSLILCSIALIPVYFLVEYFISVYLGIILCVCILLFLLVFTKFVNIKSLIK